MSGPTIEERLKGLPIEELLLMRWRLKWHREARRKQLAPPEPWKEWGVRSGRGWGKTKTGSNWLGIAAALDPKSYNFIVAPTHDDVRHTCFEGPTGLDACLPDERRNAVGEGSARSVGQVRARQVRHGDTSLPLTQVIP